MRDQHCGEQRNAHGKPPDSEYQIHRETLVAQASNWLRLGVTPVCVADGAMPFEKRAVLLARGNIAELPEMPAEVSCLPTSSEASPSHRILYVM